MSTAVKDHPDVRNAHQRLADLNERKKALQEKLDRTLKADGPTEDDLVERAFEGGSARAPELRTPAKIRKELDVVTRAIRKAEGALRNERRAAQAEAVAEVRPRYRELQRMMARQVRALLEASEREREIAAELQEAGVDTLTADLNPLPAASLRSWLEKSERF